ncbi:MAG: hypothetical protein MJZ01_00675 [Bacteroidales bacterium]|nr:hypothetical protein [Bacteroidales bacterium]
MYYICLEQPLASLVCAGVIDVIASEPSNKDIRGRVLVVAGGNNHVFDYTDRLPYELFVAVTNASIFGKIPDLGNMPSKCIVGSVEIVDEVEESYSIWQTPKMNSVWRIARPMMAKETIAWEGSKKTFGTTDLVNEDEIGSIMKEPNIKSIEYKDKKLIVSQSQENIEKYFSGEFNMLSFFIDEDVERSGLFPDLEVYDVEKVESIELVCDTRRFLFDVDSITAGIRLDEKGEEVRTPSLFEEEKEWECVIIAIGKKRMWINND